MTADLSRPLLILRLSAFGDILHTLPAVALLRSAFPASTPLGWIVEAPYRELVELTAPVDRVFTVATKRWRRWAASGATLREMRATRRSMRELVRGGTSVDFQGLVKSAVLGRIAGARDRYGFERGAIRERLASFFINRPVKIDRSVHVVDWNIALARAVCGSTLPAPAVDFGRFPADPDGKLEHLAGAIVLNPGAGHPAKRWAPDRFATLARRISAEQRSECLVVWGPGEEPMAASIAEAGRARLAPRTDLRQLAFLLSRARLVVSGDSGPLHLGAALGARVVGLYGPTRLQRNGPYGQLDGCIESTSRTMEDITVDEVLRKIEESSLP